ncbi:MAG: hypothetical protein F6K30_14965 [Cyanothece sp. SIO2G6]|nr:hypothetical protein [Cyanothece sp. SIO2G6]
MIRLSHSNRLGKQIRTDELEQIPIVAIAGRREVEPQALSGRFLIEKATPTRHAEDLGVLTRSPTPNDS